MAKGKLFEYAVLFHPKPVKDAAQNDITPPSEIIVPTTVALFRDEKEAGLKASRSIPASYDDKLEFCEVLVRPFQPGKKSLTMIIGGQINAKTTCRAA